jgi:hypothetical protein
MTSHRNGLCHIYSTGVTQEKSAKKEAANRDVIRVHG